MSATNTTTNYSLPIFISSDKPAWLVDFNGAMNAIDAQMKVNADAIATKSPILTFNDTTEIDFTKSGNIITASLASGVSDKVGRALVTPIAAPVSEQLVAINTSGVQDAINIGSGLDLSGGTLTAADLNLTIFEDAIFSVASGSGVTIESSSGLHVALNADRSIGKIYGMITVQKTGSTERIVLNTGLNVDATGEQYYISCAGIAEVLTGGSMSTADIIITSTGAVQVEMSAYTNSRNRAIIFPCLYFFTNFGDTPTP